MPGSSRQFLIPCSQSVWQAAIPLHVTEIRQPVKDVGYLWVPLAAPWWPRPLPPAKGRRGERRRLLPPDMPLAPLIVPYELQKPTSPIRLLRSTGSPRGTVASALTGCLLPPLCPTSSSSQTLSLLWTEVAVYFSSYSFLRLRWQDKVLGGEPNSRFQGRHFSTRT